MMRYVFADCELDTKLCTVRRGTTPYPLRPKPLQMLLYLLEHRDRVVPKQELAERLWPDQYISDTVIENSILAARRAIGDSGRAQRIIQTLHGHGYRLIVPVTTADDTEEEPEDRPSAVADAEETPWTEALLPAAVEGIDSAQRAAGADVAPVQSTAASPSIEAARRQLTVLFCNLVGSTVLARQVDPEDYVEIIRAYHTACAAVIERFAGHIAQYLGDGLLVYFGYPQAHEDDAHRAVYTALGILETLGQINGQLQSTHGVQVAVRLGIHTGLVVVSAVGTGGRTEPLALGETPNIAARLQDLAAANTVVLSAATYRLVSGYFACHALGAQPLPGLAEPIEVYQVLQASGVPSRFAVTVNHGLTPLVGRERERDLLRDRWTRARGGSGHVVLISGEAGIGKSRLVQALKDQVRSELHTLLECQGLPYHQHTAFWPLTELLPRVFQWQRDASTAAKLARIAHVSEQVRLPVEKTVPLFATLLALPVPEDAYAPLALTPEEWRHRIFDTLLTLILGLATHLPVLFVVEDLHWIDPSTCEFLELLVNQSPTAALLPVVTCRPTVRPSWLMRAHVTHVTLDRLGPELVQQMIGLVLGQHELPAAVRQQIVATTDGVPLFVEEVTKMVIESGLLKEREDHEARMDPLPPLAIPATLHDSLMARLDQLPAGKRVAQLGAVIGRQFTYPVLRAVTPWDEEVLHKGLEQLVDAELLYQRGYPPDATYLFKHALIQEAAYQSLLHRTRQQIHQRIAQAFVADFPETAASEPELIAHHALRGALWDQALAYSRQAGDKALARSAHREAVGSFEQALCALQHLPETRATREQAVDLRLALREALWPSGDFQRILAVLRKAETLAETLADPRRLGHISVFLSAYFHHSGAYGQAITAALRVLRNVTAGRDVILTALANLDLGRVYHAQGDYHRAIDCLQQTVGCLDGARCHGRFGFAILPSVLSRAFLAWCHADLGTFAEGKPFGDEGLQIAEAVGHPGSVMFAAWGAGLLALYQGDVPRALPLLERAVGICQDTGLPIHFPWMATALGTAYTLTARIADAVPLLTQAMKRATATEMIVTQALCSRSLGEAQMLAGRLEEAHTLTERALVLAREHQERGNEAYALRLLGDIAARCEPPECTQAESFYRQALALAEELGMRPLQAHCHRGLGTLYATGGQREQARAALSMAVEMYRGMAMTFWLPETEAALAQVDT